MNRIQYDVVLLRHAQSIKNIKKIHGGKGEALTSFGVAQTKEVALKLSTNINIANTNLYTSNSYHTKETASILSTQLCISMEQPLNFIPLYLGIADGLSEEELEAISPESNALFKKWRNREIDIKELKIPQMESYLSFWNRGLSLLNELDHNRNSILVCSNSLMILLAHIMLGNNPEITDSYKHIGIDNCGIIAFKTYDYLTYSLNDILTTEKLFN